MLSADTENSDPPTFTVYTGKQFTSFQEYTKEDIRKLLLRSPPKTCSLDPLPTNVLLESVDILCNVQCIDQGRVASGNAEDGNHHASREETRTGPRRAAELSSDLKPDVHLESD